MLKYACFAASLAFALPAWAQDSGRGRLLYETHCATCHGEKQTRHGFTLDDIAAFDHETEGINA